MQCLGMCHKHISFAGIICRWQEGLKNSSRTLRHKTWGCGLHFFPAWTVMTCSAEDNLWQPQVECLALRLLTAYVRGLDAASVCASASIGTPGAPLWLQGAQPSPTLAMYQSEFGDCLNHPCFSGKERQEMCLLSKGLSSCRQDPLASLASWWNIPQFLV